MTYMLVMSRLDRKLECEQVNVILTQHQILVTKKSEYLL